MVPRPRRYRGWLSHNDPVIARDLPFTDFALIFGDFCGACHCPCKALLLGLAYTGPPKCSRQLLGVSSVGITHSPDSIMSASSNRSQGSSVVLGGQMDIIAVSRLSSSQFALGSLALSHNLGACNTSCLSYLQGVVTLPGMHRELLQCLICDCQRILLHAFLSVVGIQLQSSSGPFKIERVLDARSQFVALACGAMIPRCGRGGVAGDGTTRVWPLSAVRLLSNATYVLVSHIGTKWVVPAETWQQQQHRRAIGFSVWRLGGGLPVGHCKAWGFTHNTFSVRVRFSPLGCNGHHGDELVVATIITSDTNDFETTELLFIDLEASFMDGHLALTSSIVIPDTRVVDFLWVSHDELLLLNWSKTGFVLQPVVNGTVAGGKHMYLHKRRQGVAAGVLRFTPPRT
ncbi:hypothetical protein Pelo_4877 [Pelomyxa schiedti]|nr:hypothetical protein Pelo_4877 [Pelomyxa schiedti]